MPGFVYTTLHSNMYVDVQNIYSHIQWLTKRTSAKYKHMIYNIFNHAKEKQTCRLGSETGRGNISVFSHLVPSLGHEIFGSQEENVGCLHSLNCSFVLGFSSKAGIVDFAQVPCGLLFLCEVKYLPLSLFPSSHRLPFPDPLLALVTHTPSLSQLRALQEPFLNTLGKFHIPWLASAGQRVQPRAACL